MVDGKNAKQFPVLERRRAWEVGFVSGSLNS